MLCFKMNLLTKWLRFLQELCSISDLKKSQSSPKTLLGILKSDHDTLIVKSEECTNMNLNEKT